MGRKKSLQILALPAASPALGDMPLDGGKPAGCCQVLRSGSFRPDRFQCLAKFAVTDRTSPATPEQDFANPPDLQPPEGQSQQSQLDVTPIQMVHSFSHQDFSTTPLPLQPESYCQGPPSPIPRRSFPSAATPTQSLLAPDRADICIVSAAP